MTALGEPPLPALELLELRVHAYLLFSLESNLLERYLPSKCFGYTRRVSGDGVDLILEQWRRERPDLDPSPIGVIGRVSRLAQTIDRELAPVFAQFGLSNGEFDVLATLRRAGEPHALTPTELSRTVMISSGGMCKRLDGLERAKLVRRTPDPSDRRGTLVVLTPRGKRLVDEAVVAHLRNEERLLSRLDGDQRARLAELLSELLRRPATPGALPS
jgi:DNA-binding MarR family transcriptional regulator